MRNVARRTDLQAVGLEDITPQLRRDAAALAPQLPGHDRATWSELGYDERFQRIWTLYLAYCEGGFAERRICDVQLLLAKPQWHQYAGPASAYDAPQALTS